MSKGRKQLINGTDCVCVHRICIDIEKYQIRHSTPCVKISYVWTSFRRLIFSHWSFSHRIVQHDFDTIRTTRINRRFYDYSIYQRSRERMWDRTYFQPHGMYIHGQKECLDISVHVRVYKHITYILNLSGNSTEEKDAVQAVTNILSLFEIKSNEGRRHRHHNPRARLSMHAETVVR